MRVVNLFAGPGTGKSTTAAALFAELKYQDHDVELVREFAKDLVWQKRQQDMRIPGFILGEQIYRMETVAPQVKLVVTDSPLLLTRVYDSSKALGQLALDVHNRYDSLNIFLKRVKAYNPNGRNETEEQARMKDAEIFSMLETLKIPFVHVTANRNAVPVIVKLINEKGWLQ